MARGMHKGPKSRNRYMEHSNEPRIGSNQEPIKADKVTRLERRIAAYEGVNLESHHRPGSNKK